MRPGSSRIRKRTCLARCPLQDVKSCSTLWLIIQYMGVAEVGVVCIPTEGVRILMSYKETILKEKKSLKDIAK